ncbi:MAG: hypothetical protein ACOXZH_00190 [Bacteroidales bacterium]|jgi:hypothetical protein|nr:hypothetical protein [Bacteroidales bacterium]
METQVYHLTSTAFKGSVVFEFTNYLLTKYDTSGAELSDKQLLFLAKYLPRELAEVKKLLGKSKKLCFEEIRQEVTFEMFWNAYDDKLHSSKKRTLAKWNRMPKGEQIKAYNYINKYRQSILPGCGKKYAETYLNAELWNN